MYSLLKDEEKYLENIDLVKQWDCFQDAACRLKDLYADTIDGARNLPNFISTIKSVECYYRNTVDLLIKKKKRYNEFGREKARLKLLEWYVDEGKHQNLDKIKLIKRVYGKQLKLNNNDNNSKKYQKIGLIISNPNSNYLHNGLVDVHHNDNNNYTALTADNHDNATILSTGFVKCESFNRTKVLKRHIDIFNDAVDLKNLQGHLSEFELNDSQCRSFIFTDSSTFCQPPRDKRRRIAKDL